MVSFSDSDSARTYKRSKSVFRFINSVDRVFRSISPLHRCIMVFAKVPTLNVENPYSSDRIAPSVEYVGSFREFVQP